MYRTKVAKLAEGGLPLAEGAFALLGRASLLENMSLFSASCLHRP